MNIKHQILSAINSNKLSLKNEGERFWHNYKIRITKLFWSRNLYDGYLIEVYDKKSDMHLNTIKF